MTPAPEGAARDILTHIRTRVEAYEPSYIDEPGLARASVLLPLYEVRGQLHVLLTRRSELVEHHKGQISFPGGAHDATDRDLTHTATRETWEEIGVDEQHIDVLGQLDEMITVSNFLVRPFVGHVTVPGPYAFSHSEVEVAEILEVPLTHLLEPANTVAELRHYQGRDVMMYSFTWNEHLIWGATARILRQFLDLVG